MKYFVLVNVLFFFSCSKTPSDIPIDSYRDVEINVDMNQTIDDGLFVANVDKLTLLLNSFGEFDMNDENDDYIFSFSISNLILGRTYEYQYAINDVLEDLEGERLFTVHDAGNIVSNYYGELDPTIVTILVNMSYQIESEKFNVDDFLDIAGDFLNNWNGTEDHLNDTDGDGIYEITFTNLEAGNIIRFKFRINGSWDENSHEFPGGDDRVHLVIQGSQTLSYWYNDEQGK